MNYKEWISSLKLDVDNSLTEEEYLNKRDVAKQFRKEIQYHQAMDNYVHNSLLRNIHKGLDTVNCLIAISLNELKIKNPQVYEEINNKEGSKHE